MSGMLLPGDDGEQLIRYTPSAFTCAMVCPELTKQRDCQGPILEPVCGLAQCILEPSRVSSLLCLEGAVLGAW
eukprot:1242092-Rhodomonas_salina.1